MRAIVRQISTEETYPLRLKVLRPGRELAEVQFPADPEAVHFGCFVDEALLSVGTIHPDDNSQFSGAGHWRIRGMATEPGERGKGYGNEILRGLLDEARARGVKLVWCNARVGALPFYKRFGFTIESELFEIPHGGPHHVMKVEL